eukprot:2873204-Prymnesium_polylepis.1
MAAELNEVPHDEMAGLLTSSHIQQILRQLLWPLSAPYQHLYRSRLQIVVIPFLKTLSPAVKHAVKFIAEAHEEHPDPFLNLIGAEDADDIGYGPEARPGGRPGRDEDSEARARVNAVWEWCMASEGRNVIFNILPNDILEHVQTEQEMEELHRVLIEWEAARSNHAEQILRCGVWYGL